MPDFAIAGAAHMGVSSFNTSLLDTITRRVRQSFRRFIDIINQPGRP